MACGVGARSHRRAPLGPMDVMSCLKCKLWLSRRCMAEQWGVDPLSMPHGLCGFCKQCRMGPGITRENFGGRHALALTGVRQESKRIASNSQAYSCLRQFEKFGVEHLGLPRWEVMPRLTPLPEWVVLGYMAFLGGGHEEERRSHQESARGAERVVIAAGSHPAAVV